MRRLHAGLPVAALCALALGCPSNAVAQNPRPDSKQSSNTEGAKRAAPIQELPDSPGTTWAKAQEPVAPAATPPSSPQSDAQTPDANSTPKDKDVPQQDQKLQRPVGTAAAEAPKVNGVTAAQPAGAAIAPAKQHRVRTLVLKVGAILGAGAAVGTVLALSAATPSRPPGAHSAGTR